MLAFAALTGPLPKVGVVAVAGVVAAALLVPGTRTRAVAILAALVLAPVLLLADIWHSPQLGPVHRHPLLAVLGALVALAVLAGVAAVINRRPALFGLLAVAALPFRVPIQAGGTTSNLLVPLYLVVAAGALAFVVPALRNRGDGAERNGAVDDVAQPGWVERLLALYVVLYAIQSVYSVDFEKALQQMAFFYVPFAVMFCLLRRLRWTPVLVRRCLLLITALAVVFAVIGFVEYATKTIILNPKLVVANDLHTYFTVNSVFFDPDIFGRFLALVMILLAAVLIYSRRQREQLSATGALAVLWAGLVLTLSRSSLAALLLGLAILAALRWKVGRAVLVGAAVLALGAAVVAISPNTFGLNQGLNGASSGRAGLVSGGLDMFRDRPLWGYGSGAFVAEYRARHRHTNTTLAASHTIAITIAAEQGLIGEVPYVALVLVAAVVLLKGSRSDPTRAAIAAAFLALVFHTLLYADFLEDPVTWALLGVGTALAVPRPRLRSAGLRTGEAVRVPV
ncbi:MAG: O-antigen ligase family protein [Solirubrobacterales bacterium]|nr:O-antigen ligase family protein [Solirubrobacterales bacterium]